MRIRSAATLTFLALLAGLITVAATPSQASAAGKPCWERVIDDWLDNGAIDKRYAPSCYRQALKHVPEDLRDYSNITDAINAALQDALRPGARGGIPGAPGGGNGVPGAGNDRRLQASPSKSLYRKAIDNLGTTNADSLPIPLLVLAGLGTALLLTAGGLAARKRLRARRSPPPST
jgi:hypothetical protein